MIKKFDNYIQESLRDKMIGLSDEDIRNKVSDLNPEEKKAFYIKNFNYIKDSLPKEELSIISDKENKYLFNFFMKMDSFLTSPFETIMGFAENRAGHKVGIIDSMIVSLELKNLRCVFTIHLESRRKIRITQHITLFNTNLDNYGIMDKNIDLDLNKNTVENIKTILLDLVNDIVENQEKELKEKISSYQNILENIDSVKDTVKNLYL